MSTPEISRRTRLPAFLWRSSVEARFDLAKKWIEKGICNGILAKRARNEKGFCGEISMRKERERE
ncbi:MAG: hypothetical protein HFJ65_02720 [Eggerthellaceae bacterium]|nr:hypothetical protein [Eggerthellaceae bacterium]